jgi:hypothetical protein
MVISRGIHPLPSFNLVTTGFSLVQGWTLAVRRGPSSGKMWPGAPPSKVALAKHLHDIFHARVIIPLTPVKASNMNVVDVLYAAP